MKDALGDRMKQQYEDRTRYQLPRRTYTILRIDGKAFHTYTKDCERPFDIGLHDAMIVASQELCKEAQGCEFAYTQSDEVSFLLTDFARNETCAWFDGNVQKINSVAASVFTSAFDFFRDRNGYSNEAYFDCRVFTIPDPVEVENYFIWRNKDAIRNSVSSLAQSLFSAKQLHGKSTASAQLMCQDAGHPWTLQPEWARYGTVVYKVFYETDATRRSKWEPGKAWDFTDSRTWLKNSIPRYESETVVV